jgi:CDP-glycerol glycerophosphotransferase (TagB/SpsB family)
MEQLILGACFELPSHRIWITGSPRNDALFHCSADLAERHPFLRRKVVLYAPTWRENGVTTRIFPFAGADLSRVRALLDRHDAYLLLRAHVNESSGRDGEIGAGLQALGERLILANADRFPDVQELLPFVDVLVTDYSSLYFDFLLLDRPMVFVPYDLDEYRRVRGFTIDYESFTPGPRVVEFEHFLAALDRALADPEHDAEVRAGARRLFHAYPDGQSSSRVLARIAESV